MLYPFPLISSFVLVGLPCRKPMTLYPPLGQILLHHSTGMTTTTCPYRLRAFHSRLSQLFSHTLFFIPLLELSVLWRYPESTTPHHHIPFITDTDSSQTLTLIAFRILTCLSSYLPNYLPISSLLRTLTFTLFYFDFFLYWHSLDLPTIPPRSRLLIYDSCFRGL
jgi:hypothetical protein